MVKFNGVVIGALVVGAIAFLLLGRRNTIETTPDGGIVDTRSDPIPESVQPTENKKSFLPIAQREGRVTILPVKENIQINK